METPQPMAGTWRLTAPDGRYWDGMTPLAACRAEMSERVPPSVQLARVMAFANETTDSDRLDWMCRHEAWIAWNREGDLCRVYVRSDDEDDYRPEPVCGWPKFFDSAREAIDAAMVARSVGAA